MDQRVINTVESLIHNTTGRIKDVQSNLIPFYNKGLIKHVNHYRMFNIQYMAENDYQTILLVGDLKYKDTIIPQKDRSVYRKTMNEAMSEELIHPFLLFVNGKFIKWSNIEIVNDVNYSYIIANGVDYKTAFKFDIIQIPFNIYYSEDGNIKENTEEMFRFDDNGELSDIGKTVISYNASTSKIHMDKFDAPSGNVLGWDILNVDDKVKLFPENIILFKDGKLYSDANILIDPMNVISIDDGNSEGMIEGRVFYDECSNLPKNNVYNFHGNNYISDLFKNVQRSNDDVPYYVTKLREDFDFEFSIDKSYEQNILDSISYIYDYNPQLLYPAHESPITIRTWTGKQVNELLDQNNNLVMLRDKYNGHKTYVLPFLNGELYEFHSQIIYKLSTFTLSFPNGLEDDDILEIVYFRNIDNYTISGHVTQANKLVSLDGYIERDDLLVYSDRHNDMKFPTIGTNSRLAYRVEEFTWDENTKEMSFEDDFYYGRDLTFVSKNRFIYIGYDLRQKCFKFRLSDHFKYCDNQKQFMVFINGRRLSQDEYNITILKNTRPFDELYLYSAKVLDVGDKLDVFYVPYPLYGMYMYKSEDEFSVKVNTEENVFTYDIPVPYKSFLSDGGQLEIVSAIRDTEITLDGYTINSNNTVTFNSSTELPERLTFKFEYLKNKGIHESGYVYLNKDKIPVPFCKELCMLFVNGKKVPNDCIYNISSDCIRITTDIQSTYDVSVMMYRDIITDLVGLMNNHVSSIDSLVNSISEEELNKLNGTFSTITDVEDKFVIDAQKISIINEIVRDFYMKPGINQGVPFLYDYDTDAFVYQDSEDNWIIPTMDATQFINIIEEDGDDIIGGLDLPDASTYSNYDIHTFTE